MSGNGSAGNASALKKNGLSTLQAGVILAFATLIALAAYLFPLPVGWTTVDGLSLSPAGQTAMGILIFGMSRWTC